MGTIARLTVETTKESEFSKGIERFSRFILRMILVTLVFIFVANLLIKGENADIIELVVFSIALVVSVVPEALPVVTTVSLSRGALQLAKQGVIVKRLTAIEDIGGIEILCADKTGTLTENTLQVTEMSPGRIPTCCSMPRSRWQRPRKRPSRSISQSWQAGKERRPSGQPPTGAPG